MTLHPPCTFATMYKLATMHTCSHARDHAHLRPCTLATMCKLATMHTCDHAHLRPCALATKHTRDHAHLQPAHHPLHTTRCTPPAAHHPLHTTRCTPPAAHHPLHTTASAAARAQASSAPVVSYVRTAVVDLATLRLCNVHTALMQSSTR
eukprot:365423-Chlamydomonas_euryale.AAC.11